MTGRWRKKLNRAVTVLLAVAVLSLGAAGTSRWWRSLDPDRTISGQVVDKTAIASQGKRSRVRYQLTVDAAGRHERVVVSAEMYRAVHKGWRFEQHGSHAVVTARSMVY